MRKKISKIKKYIILAQAKKALRKLGIKTINALRLGNKKPMRNSIDINQVYSDKWEGWHAFLNHNKSEELRIKWLK